MQRQATQRERMSVQLIFMHRCPHSDSSLLRCSVTTAEQSFAPFGRCADPPLHGGRTADNSACNQARRGAPPNVFDCCQFRSVSALHHPPAHFSRAASASQLRFREELMHQLLDQLPPDKLPRRHGEHLPPPNAPASIHSSELSSVDRDCKQCSHQPKHRKRTSYVCNACQVHLCLGECFRAYHARLSS